MCLRRSFAKRYSSLNQISSGENKMKKTTTALFLALIFVFSVNVNVLADGDLPMGGKTCQQNTTCCPTGSTCLSGTQTPTTDPTKDSTIFQTMLDYLSGFFTD